MARDKRLIEADALAASLDPNDPMASLVRIKRAFQLLEEVEADLGARPEDRAEARAELAHARQEARHHTAEALAMLSEIAADETADEATRADARAVLQEAAEKMRAAGHDVVRWQKGSETKQ